MFARQTCTARQRRGFGGKEETNLSWSGIQKTPGSRSGGTRMGFERMLEAGESLCVSAYVQFAGSKLTTMLISSTSCTSLRICINNWRPPLLHSVCTFLQTTVSWNFISILICFVLSWYLASDNLTMMCWPVNSTAGALVVIGILVNKWDLLD